MSRLRNHAQIIRLRRRQPLPTASPDTIFILRSGLIAAENVILTTHRTMVELLYPGDIIAPALQPVAPGITYSTMADSEIWRLRATALKTEMANDTTLAEFVLQRLNLQRARMQLHIATLAALTSEQRVAALLLEAACHFGNSAGGAIGFDMPLSRVEIAEYLALNADTLSRIMSRLVRDRTLARSSRTHMTISNLEALKESCPLSSTVIALHSEERA